MKTPDESWEERAAALWREIDAHDPEAFTGAIDALAAELSPGSAIALFERGAAQDSTGRPDRAVPLYEAALAVGLTGLRRRRAAIQMASSVRNLGDPARAVELLTSELEAPSDDLDGAVRGLLALALVDLGREREALSMSLVALAGYLPRYNRSLANYARDLVLPR